MPGKPALFGTTRVFLDYFGLKSLDELPPLAELKDIAELEPQLPFEPEAAAAACRTRRRSMTRRRCPPNARPTKPDPPTTRTKTHRDVTEEADAEMAAPEQRQ